MYPSLAAQPQPSAPPAYAQADTIPVQSQPLQKAAAPPTVVVVQPGAQPESEWKYGLFDCFGNCSLCCLTWCCPCFPFGNTSQVSGFGDSHCCFFCLAATLGSECAAANFFICFQRKHIREKHNIPGSDMGDCCAAFCCPLCVICQNARQVDAYAMGEVDRAEDTAETIERT